MTDQQHPLTPPPELTAKFWREATAGRNDAPFGEIFNYGIQLAYAAGADQELQACCEWLRSAGHLPGTISVLLAARRPEPPSLKQQALDQLAFMEDRYGHLNTDYIRRALEQLND